MKTLCFLDKHLQIIPHAPPREESGSNLTPAMSWFHKGVLRANEAQGGDRVNGLAGRPGHVRAAGEEGPGFGPTRLQRAGPKGRVWGC